MLPWPDMMRAALALGISPEAFWRLSLREWRWLSASPHRPMSRTDFEALCAADPETRSMETEDG